MKSWEEWTHAERAIFISHLNQPHDALDRAIRERDRRWHDEASGIITAADELERRIASQIDQVKRDEATRGQSTLGLAQRSLNGGRNG